MYGSMHGALDRPCVLRHGDDWRYDMISQRTETSNSCSQVGFGLIPGDAMRCHDIGREHVMPSLAPAIVVSFSLLMSSWHPRLRTRSAHIEARRFNVESNTLTVYMIVHPYSVWYYVECIISHRTISGRLCPCGTSRPGADFAKS